MKNNKEQMDSHLLYLYSPPIKKLLCKLKKHHEESYEHSIMTTTMYYDFCRFSSLNECLTIKFLRSVLMRDIGNLLLPPSMLDHQHALTRYDSTLIKKHPEYSLNIVSQYPEIDIDPRLILHHHENINGTGYPTQLTHHSIPDSAKIVRIIDAYTNMSSMNTHTSNFTYVQYLSNLKSYVNIHFDSEYLSLFSLFIENQSQTEQRDHSFVN
ncbi:HD domain-containing phosphohydrolase [Halobacillus litoralis]|uniref:HD-GYP domain-containing protein n=1 Tax=Halobacillus litoralis TaxID=45668 RepID=UPI001CFE93FB|nr:HD domain-containing phosphohydrolase [Halobacillus litoralis]WLR47307.1 HD domain-containing phosphohydrolase [Halobacillus litoralis]